MKIFILLTMVFSAFAYGGSGAPKEDPVPFWQQSESVNIQLGTRDKNGALQSYEAAFSVQLQGSDVILEAKTTVSGDAWAFVYFPESFPPGAKDGEYSWKCTVNGKVTASGSFIFGEDQRTLTIPKKQK
jgi:hypothetical protein